MNARVVIIAFTVAALLMLAAQSFAAVDDAYTVNLFHFNGDIIDDSGTTWTPAGDATASATEKKFGTGALCLDGIGDYLAASDSDDWSFGADPFTVDCWLYVVSHNSQTRTVFSQQKDSGDWDGFSIQILDTNKVCFSTVFGPSLIDADVFPTSQWVHIAITRTGDDWRLFRDGNMVANASSSYSMPDIPKSRYIGCNLYSGSVYYPFTGYIDEMRFSKGIARWTSEFTPPVSEYVPVTLIKPVYLCSDGYLRLANGGRLYMR